jgi:hypothetical protein
VVHWRKGIQSQYTELARGYNIPGEGGSKEKTLGSPSPVSY